MSNGAGRLVAIALRGERRAAMREVAGGEITTEAGLVGDHKGLKFKKRAITVLATEDWAAALASLPGTEDDRAADLPWTVRRANLLVEGVRLPRAVGAVLDVGSVQLEVTAPTVPCRRMEEAHPGLLKALAQDWRGGVTARVLTGGPIALGDAVRVVSSPPEQARRRLP